jgi:uracil-DNA glycosylase family 4
MSESKDLLLAETIRYLEGLKKSGETFVTVSRETLDLMRSTKGPRPAARASARTVLPAAPLAENRGNPLPGPALPNVAQATLVIAPTSSGEKGKALEQLSLRAGVCVKCPQLANSRKTVVFGVGDPYSPLMFIGEAPGADEDEAGEPFVGKAGQLLTRIIQTMGFSRDNVYIANILKCRPDTPGEKSGNRKPTPEEMQTCLPYLLAQIDIIKPRVIVALGGTAMEGLFGKTLGITKLRGTYHTFREIPVMPTYHPSYLLRNQALSVKREVWEDMLKVLETLERPISEKQRNYFLQP